MQNESSLTLQNTARLGWNPDSAGCLG